MQRDSHTESILYINVTTLKYVFDVTICVWIRNIFVKLFYIYKISFCVWMETFIYKSGKTFVYPSVCIYLFLRLI